MYIKYTKNIVTNNFFRIFNIIIILIIIGVKISYQSNNIVNIIKRFLMALQDKLLLFYYLIYILIALKPM